MSGVFYAGGGVLLNAKRKMRRRDTSPLRNDLFFSFVVSVSSF